MKNYVSCGVVMRVDSYSVSTFASFVATCGFDFGKCLLHESWLEKVVASGKEKQCSDFGLTGEDHHYSDT
jgi:hypothetical protein